MNDVTVQSRGGGGRGAHECRYCKLVYKSAFRKVCNTFFMIERGAAGGSFDLVWQGGREVKFMVTYFMHRPV